MGDMVYDRAGRRRHWLIAAVASIACLALLTLLSTRFTASASVAGPHPAPQRLVWLSLATIACLLAIIAVREGLSAAFAGIHKRQGIVTWRNLLAWTLYAVLFAVFANSLGVQASTLLFGAGIATIVLATLAQASLSNVFAGIVLMLARPYRVGEQLYLRSGQFGGAEYEGIVVDIGAFYTILSSHGELIKVPNISVIASVLMTRYRPKRADVELEVPAGTNIDEIEDAVRTRLSLAAGSRIRVEPLGYDSTEGDAKMKFRLQVYAEQSIDSNELLRAIHDAAGGRVVAIQKRALG